MTDPSFRILSILCALLSGTSLLSSANTTPIIDTHVHLWSLDRPDGIYWIPKNNKTLYRSFMPEDHTPIAKANGITGVVIVQAGQYLPDNQWNLDITAHDPTLYRGVVGNLSQVIGHQKFQPLFHQLCQNERYLGYRISGRTEETLTEAFFDDLKTTAKHGKTVDILVGQYSLADVSLIATRVPELKIIIDHFGGVTLDGKPLDEAWIKSFRKVAKHPNVFCKVSALFGRVKQQPAPLNLDFYKAILELSMECFGEDRLVFGSDWPVTRTTADYAAVLKLTRAFVDEKGPMASAKIFSENATKFYGLSSIVIGKSSKVLPLPGKSFQVNGRDAFVILPEKTEGDIPWVWYAPTLRGLPAKSEVWMFKKFLEQGVAIAGIDVGESYGSPDGRKAFTELYQHLTTNLDFRKKPCLLARSRGGLMLYNWAVENPEKVAGVAGIYPVCNLESYPGLPRAAGAYGMTAAELKAALPAQNPITRLKPLADARVPIFHIHGDSDTVVPLEKNTALLASSYRKLGGPVQVEVVEGQGHNMWSGWFESSTLTSFVIARAHGKKAPQKAGQ